jgi:hypothetical protein
VSLDQRQEMRRCGKPYPTEEAASRAKRVLSGLAVPVECPRRCGSYHLEAVRASSGLRPFPARVAAQLDERDDRCCQRCGRTRGIHRHHRRGKASGGSRRKHTQCACNGVLLCWRCHHWAHVTHRAQAEAEGFIVSQSVDEPASAGVMRFAGSAGGVTQWPACSGEWAGTADEAREVAA